MIRDDRALPPKIIKQIDKQIGVQVAAEAPRVSIVIPNYNGAEFIAETLDSVFAQTFTGYEVIVINDGSPDTGLLKKVLVPYLERIVFIDSDKNYGAASARNTCITEARGSVIAFVDADDIWLPEYLQAQLDFLDKHGFDMVYTDCTLFGRTSRPGFDMRANNPAEGPIVREQFIGGKCHILPSGVVIKKSEAVVVGMFDETVPTAEDFEFFMRLIFAGTNIGYQRKCLFRYRISPSSESADVIHRLNRNIFIWRLLQDRLHFTAEENATIEKHVQNEEAALLRTKGRIEIINGNWTEAAGYFSQAKQMAKELGLPLKHKLKLGGVLLMLKYAPKQLQKMMAKARPEESALMPDRI
jgi:glycosyltransferase involved in cell wall biosynthesis